MLRVAVGLALGAALVVAAVAQPPGGAQPKAKAKQKREPLVIPDVPRDQLVCFCLYTVHNKTLKLTAQLYPLKDGEERKVTLAIDRGDGFKPARRRTSTPTAGCATFRVEKWDDTKPAKYRVTHAGGTTLRGHHPQEPDRQGRDRRRQPVVQLEHRPRPAGRHRRQPQGPGPGPALLRRRPELRPQGALRGLAAVRPAVRRGHQGPADGHDPGRPRRRPPEPLGRRRQAVAIRRTAPTAATSCRSSTSTWCSRQQTQPPARPVRPDAGAPRHHRLLHRAQRRRDRLRHPGRPQVEDRPGRAGAEDGPAAGPRHRPELRPPRRSTCPRRSCSASGS